MRRPSCRLTLKIKNLNFEDVTSLISDIIFLHQLAQARPHNALHFLVNHFHFLVINIGVYCQELLSLEFNPYYQYSRQIGTCLPTPVSPTLDQKMPFHLLKKNYICASK